jgi:hypothetical protein
LQPGVRVAVVGTGVYEDSGNQRREGQITNVARLLDAQEASREPYHLAGEEQSRILTICRSCRSRTRHTG